MAAVESTGSVPGDIETQGINVIRGLAMDAVQKPPLRAPGHADGAGAARPRALHPDHELRRGGAATGPTATGSCCRTGTRRCSSTRCSTSPASGSSSTTSSSSASGARRPRATPSTATSRASRSRPVRSARASRNGSASRSPRRTCGSGSAPRSSTTTSFAICGDGYLEEGVSHEAASLAGHLGLGRLVAVYDDNHITIDGPTELALHRRRARALRGLRLARRRARRGRQRPRRARGRRSATAWPRPSRPSLLVLRSHIGYPSPKYTDTAKAHGDALGADEVARGQGDPRPAARRALLRPRRRARVLPRRRRRAARRRARRGSSERAACERRGAGPRRRVRRVPRGHAASTAGRAKLPTWSAGRGGRDPRGVLGQCSTRSSTSCPAWSAAAPTSPATPARRSTDAGVIGTARLRRPPDPLRHPRARHGRGHERHGGRATCCPFGGTFFVFSDYMRGAVRLAALSRLQGRVRVVARLGRRRRGRPDAPADRAARGDARDARAAGDPSRRRQRDRARRGASTSTATGPTAIILTRQKLPVLEGTAERARRRACRAARTCSSTRSRPGPTSCSSAPVPRCSSASARTRSSPLDGVSVRVVSMPSWDLFAALDRRVAGRGAPARRARRSRSRPAPPSAGSATPTTSSASTTSARRRPGDVAMREFGFTPEHVVAHAAALLALEEDA